MFLKRKVEDLIGKRSAALKIKFLQTKLNNGRSIDKSWPVIFCTQSVMVALCPRKKAGNMPVYST